MLSVNSHLSNSSKLSSKLVLSVSKCTYNEIGIVAGVEYLPLFSLRITAYC